jgi:hypothetical protein
MATLDGRAREVQPWTHARAAMYPSRHRGGVRVLSNHLLETLRSQNPQLPDLLVKPLLAHFLSAYQVAGGDLAMHIITLVIAMRTVEHPDFSSLSMRERLEDVPVFPSLGLNSHSIAESSGIPYETVRRKVAKLERKGWIVRQGSTLHFTSKGYRENSLVREAREHLAVEYYETVRQEVLKLPPAQLDAA